jgi:hypothetical protein
MRDLVHALPDADGGREVINGIDASERASEGVTIAHIADNELDFRVEIFRALSVVPVYLRREMIERTHAIAAREKLVG